MLGHRLGDRDCAVQPRGFSSFGGSEKILDDSCDVPSNMLVVFAKKWATFIRLVADEHRSSFDRTGIPAAHKQSFSPSKVSAGT